MNTTTVSPSFAAPIGAPPAARHVLRLMQRLVHGTLTLQLPDGSSQRFGNGQSPHATLVLRNWKVCAASLKSGDIGFAESYFTGDWNTPNLAELLKLFVANRKLIDDVVYGSWAGRLLYRLKHLLNRNTRANSQKNIHAHYDLGNAFYRLWLDDTMNYSSAWFEGNRSAAMGPAQDAKVRRALRLAGVRPGDRVLELGCGWGALAQMAAVEFGASVTGVTLSSEQLEFAQERMARAGGNARMEGAGGSDGMIRTGDSAKADLRLQDYRDITDAPFDAVCSIEMVEAVGREYWPEYFKTVHRLLKPGGRACIQSIVIDDTLWDRYIHSTDFIQQYIFPGGCLPCPREFRREAAAAGFDLVDELAFGLDYAETLRRWRDRFIEQRSQVLQLGFDERFIRIWEFYLAYCEAAFEQSNIDVVQYTLVRR